ncbi:MAG: flagellar biosynthetic protein FliP [Candidatus Dadabacteria bacterium]|nr:MAG: flagellar biosynthetic protein FliP [Candidatus Dadabacteria bacterium]
MQKRFKVSLAAVCLIIFFIVAAAGMAYGEEVSAPALSIKIGDTELAAGGGISSTLKLVFLISAITFLPAAILTMTCFTRIAVVLSMTRMSLGVQQIPPNTVITGLALFLTIAILNPVFQRMYDEGIKPYIDGQMAEGEAFQKTFAPLKKFLIRHSRDKDIGMFLRITKSEVPEDVNDIPLFVAAPAFVISELMTAFQIAFIIALPFLVLDMVVSSVLTSMSMITLPPVVISLPLKLMLFVLVDGWHLIIGSLIETYHVA